MTSDGSWGRAFQFGGKFESLNALRKNEVAETSSGDRGPPIEPLVNGLLG